MWRAAPEPESSTQGELSGQSSPGSGSAACQEELGFAGWTSPQPCRDAAPLPSRKDVNHPNLNEQL